MWLLWLQQEQLDCQREKLRKRMGTLDLQTELAATTAKIEYLKTAESQAVKGRALDAMNTYLEENVEGVSLPFSEQLRDTRLKDGVQVQFPVSYTLPRTPRIQYSSREQSIYPLQAPSRSSVPNPGQDSDNLSKILEKQNQLTSLLIKQQMLNTLPKGDLTAFDGNVLQYKSFIHSFEHMIESRTDNNQDRLQFLIQYTKGQAQQLVKSCQHMDANRGY